MDEVTADSETVSEISSLETAGTAVIVDVELSVVSKDADAAKAVMLIVCNGVPAEAAKMDESTTPVADEMDISAADAADVFEIPEISSSTSKAEVLTGTDSLDVIGEVAASDAAKSADRALIMKAIDARDI